MSFLPPEPVPEQPGNSVFGGAAVPAEDARIPVPDGFYVSADGELVSVPPTPVARSNRLGRVALALALGVLVLSVAASVVIALFSTSVSTYGASGASSSGFHAEPTGAASFWHIPLGTILGLWALIQGIVAIVQNRGRGAGIAAVAIAFAAPGVTLLVWAVVAAVAGHRVN